MSRLFCKTIVFSSWDVGLTLELTNIQSISKRSSFKFPLASNNKLKTYSVAFPPLI